MTDDDAARRYHRRQLLLSGARVVLGVALLAALLLTGAAHALAVAAGRLSGAAAVQVAIVATGVGAARSLLDFPLACVAGFVLPRRHSLLHQPFRGWLGDRVKAAALGGVLALAGVEVVYALMGVTEWWWLAVAAIFLAVSVIGATVLPVWVMPMFYRLTPLADQDLRARLVTLAERAGIRALGVWVADQSRKSRTANAALVGLGRTRRIILFDTLIATFTPREIEAVLAHELGHHVHGDVRRGLLAQAALTALTFWIAAHAMTWGVTLWSLRGVDDPAGLPWLALVIAGVGAITLPLGNTFSRFVERQADTWALATTRDPDAFVGAMERLATLNLAERRPSRFKEIVLYSHPALDSRIARARGETA
ncbi:MAG TPA: M48 family metalloprotease [Candidatus Limnocylindria bacterium]|nr:M48 family metalloprotease [Candidatus Limnocylindria bacterium]